MRNAALGWKLNLSYLDFDPSNFEIPHGDRHKYLAEAQQY